MTVFSFRTGQSLIHRLDVRFKLLFLIMISVTTLQTGIIGLAGLTLAFTGLVFYLRIRFFSLIRAVRYFLLLLAVIFTARVLSAAGEPVGQVFGITATREGVYQGLQVCLRLWLLVLLGLAFIATSRPSEIRSAVAWCLKPVPWVNGGRVATMLSLVIRFIPMIFDQAAKTGDAQRARAVENRKNPLYRLKKFAFPFMRRTFEDADRLVVAMEARCYSEERTGHAFSAKRLDWLTLGVVLGICGLLLVLF